MSLNTGWFIGISSEKKKDTEQAIRNSTITLRQLQIFIEHEIEALDRVPLEDYNTPAWPYKEADRLGQLRALRKLLTLVKLS